ncbi:hypothetical protein DMUE_4433 [Dictyocoela muelleri]|nr:hypothetical protein DMUE_4433 [Dictyocoela muelleri]
MRIMKFRSIHNIIHKCINNLNYCYNTAIKEIPHNILSAYENKDLEILKLVNERNIELNLKNLKKTNKKRKEYKFKIGDKILIKNIDYGKNKNLYNGPYFIHKIHHHNSNFLEIKKENGIFRVNIKNIKPLF